MTITWNYNDALSLVPDDYTAALVLMYEANKIRQKVREAGSHE
jgi:hypothetical protein